MHSALALLLQETAEPAATGFTLSWIDWTGVGLATGSYTRPVLTNTGTGEPTRHDSALPLSAPVAVPVGRWRRWGLWDSWDCGWDPICGAD